MAGAKTFADVILGEAASGTPQERYRDMVAIASVVANRAAQTGQSFESIISAPNQFSAYGRSLPPGTSAYRSLAQQAIDEVQRNGPVHNATFYATPSATKNLPKGLDEVTQTSGHVYYSDPKNRAINTAAGYKTPQVASMGLMEATNLPTPDHRPVDPSVQSPFQALLGEDPAYTSSATAYSPEPEMAQTSVPVRSVKTTSYTQQAPLSELRQPQMSLADQYASYGAGRQPTELAGLLRQDVAQQRMIDQLNAQKQQLAAGVNPMDAQPAWTPRVEPVQQPIQQPAEVQPVQSPEVTSYQAPAQQQPQQGLLSPDERAMYEQQYSLLGQQPLNSNTKQKISQGLKNGLGTFGGALAGGLLGGPVGGLLGGFLGNRIVGRGLLSAYPKAPESRSRGDGSLTDYGREVRGESRQFNDAVSSGAVGLW